MPVNQRDVILLPHPFGSQYAEDHPHVIISIKECNDHEATALAVMMTGSDQTHDEYSFDVSDEMFEKPLKKQNCHIRMHLIALYLKEDMQVDHNNKPIVLNRMNVADFNRLMRDIGELVFEFSFKPL